MGINRAPPARLSPCSQTLLERAVRVYMVAEEGPKRERRHHSALARRISDMVVLTVRGTVREAVARIVTVEAEAMLVTQGRLCCSGHTVGSVYTCFCVLVSVLLRPYSTFVG